jgi:hypothetical protein
MKFDAGPELRPMQNVQKKKPDYRLTKVVVEFPEGFSAGRPIAACRSVAMKGWELGERNSGGSTATSRINGGNRYTVICHDQWVFASEVPIDSHY